MVVTAWPLYAREGKTESIEQGAGWDPKPGCTFWRRGKSLVPTRIPTPDRPARSLVAIPTT